MTPDHPCAEPCPATVQTMHRLGREKQDLLGERDCLRRALIDLTNQVVPPRWQEAAGRFHCTAAERQALEVLDATKPAREEQANDA